MLYVYSNHLGGIYWATYELDFEELFCPTCGDADLPIGEAATVDEMIDLLCFEEGGMLAPDYIAEQLEIVTEGKIKLPDSSWQNRSYSATIDDRGFGMCNEFHTPCNLCSQNGGKISTWCEECCHNFAAALRDVNNKELLHMEL